MKVQGQHFETIWLHKKQEDVIQIIDQRYLPFEFRIEEVRTSQEMFTAIRDMHLRGAPLIGAAGAMGMYLAIAEHDGEVIPPSYVEVKANTLKSARPTAVNLAWAVEESEQAINEAGRMNAWRKYEMKKTAKDFALKILEHERLNCLEIGKHGLPLIEAISKKKKGQEVNILTHCNAGWLACIDYGTALAPIYLAHDKGIKLHVWVDETRPRNQGARLTAWELQQHGVSCTIIADNAGGHLMQSGMVDIVIVGSDRASVFGDVVNKIGTYLKALSAKDNNIPFYAALPSTTIDWHLKKGASETPIELRDGDELRIMEGLKDGVLEQIVIIPENTAVMNHGFDITPARLVTGIITERGISKANKKSIFALFPDKINPDNHENSDHWRHRTRQT